MKKNVLGFCLGAMILCPEASLACSQLTVDIGGSLSADAQIIYSTKPEKITSDDAPVIQVPLDDINGDQTVLMLRLTRANSDEWRIDFYNDLKSDTPVESSDFQGPYAEIRFDSNGQQELPVALPFLPVSKNNEVANSTVQLVIRDLSITKGSSELKILSLKKEGAKCFESPKTVFRKKEPNSERDELNPIVGEEAYEAYLK